MLRRRARWLLGSLDRNRKAANRPQYVVVLRDGLSEGQLEVGVFHLTLKDRIFFLTQGKVINLSGFYSNFILLLF
jgi:hypothetical protein